MDQLICDALRGELNAEIALSPGFRWGTTALAGQPLTMEDVMAQTAVTYPETYVQTMTGGQIKDVLEDVCDNLFNTDPYYQQGGDMVRVGGFAYTCSPNETVGQADFRTQARQRPRAGSRQELQGGRLGLRQRADRRSRSGMSFAKHLEIRQAAATGRGTGVTLKGVDGQSGHCRTGMSGFSTTHSRDDRGASDRSRRARCPSAPSRHSCRTSRLPNTRSFCSSPTMIRRKQSLVLSVTSNLMKHYDPDKVAIEIVTFGPGIELLRPENPNRKMVESLVAQGARFDICLNTVDTLEREAGKRPEFISAATPVQVGVAQILFLTENGYTLVRP